MNEVVRQGLYDPRNEHDSCGVGFVINIKGRKSHDIITQGLKILENLDHRGAVGADPLMGAGCLIRMPDSLLAGRAPRAKTCPGRASMPSRCASCRGRTKPAPMPSSGSSTWWP